MRVLVLGAGDVGNFLSKRLSDAGHEVFLVDSSADALAEVDESADILAVQGDCTHQTVLRGAGAHEADIAIAVTGSDHANLIAAALAAKLGARRSLARVDDPKFFQTSLGVEEGVLGVHSVLCASRLISEELLRHVAKIGLRFVGSYCDNRAYVLCFPIVAESPLIGRAPLDVKVVPGATIVGVLRDAIVRSPEDVASLETDDELVIAGETQPVFLTIRRLARASKRGLIIGGGDVGMQLARSLAGVENRVQLIEQDRARCEVIAQELPAVNVIHGDGTSISDLRDEQAGTADYVLSVTKRDEVNLMASLVAHDLGVGTAMALVHRSGYAQTYAHLGLAATAGAHGVILRAVQSLTPGLALLQSDEIEGTGYCACEVLLSPGRGAGVALGDLALPDGVFVAAVSVGGEFKPPSPALHLDASTRLVLVTATTAAPDLQKGLAEKRGRRR